MPPDLDCVFYIGKTPTIDFRDGMFHICYEIGRHARFEIVLSPQTFRRGMALAEDAMAKARYGDLPSNNVTRLR
jgi:hypothetical protein